MKRTNRFLAMLLVVCTVVMMCMPLSALAADWSPSEWRSVTGSRDDGVFLFPIRSSDGGIGAISDWAGCPGDATCALCGYVHSAWSSWACSTYHTGNYLGHQGMDIGVTTKDVLAPADGYVYWSSTNWSGRGYTVIMEHPIGNGYSYYSVFQHLSNYSVVTSGSHVTAGTKIAVTGNSGQGSGYHLHFGMVIDTAGRGNVLAQNCDSDSGLWGLEKKGWVTSGSGGTGSGRIVVNPMHASGYLETPLIDGSSWSMRAHCGSVKYTYDTSKVTPRPYNVTELNISGETYPTGNLNLGDPFYMYGVITSPNALKSVTVGIFTNDGDETSEVRTYTSFSNPNSFDIHATADYDIIFDNITKAGYYRYKVIATNQTETKVLIDSQFTMGNPSRPAKPVLSTSVNNTSVTVSWQQCSGATGYDIYFFKKNDDSTIIHKKYGVTSTSYTTEFDPGEYMVHVAAVNANMTSCYAFSDWAYFTTKEKQAAVIDVNMSVSGNVFCEDISLDAKNLGRGQIVVECDDYQLKYLRTEVSDDLGVSVVNDDNNYMIIITFINSEPINISKSVARIYYEYDASSSGKDVLVCAYSFGLYDGNEESIDSNLFYEYFTFPIVYHTVTFKDWDGTTLKTQSVEHGASATAPAAPSRPGYQFTGWDKSFTNVTSDLVITAQYALIQTNANIVVTSVEGKPGETVRVPIMVENNPGIMAIGIDVAYDANVLELVGTEKGVVFSDSGVIEVTSPNLTVNPYRYTLTDATNEYTADGVIVTYIFKIKESAQPGTVTNLTLTVPFAYNLAEQQQYFNAKSGEVSIIPPISVYTVTFKDWDGTVLKTQEVNEGDSATAPANPTRPGYVFTGWDKDFTNVHSDLVVTAKYRLANGAELTVQSKTTQAGQTVEVAVEIAKNPGIMYLRVTPDYDKSYLTLTGVKNGNVFPDNAFSYDTNVTYDVMSDNTANGTLLIMTFKVADNAPEGSYRIGIIVRECYNYNEDDVDVTSADGMITVSSILYGDVNGDGVIDGKDVIRLRKYLAAYDDETGTSTVEIGAGADCNGDGKVDGKDLVRLRKYLAAYDDDTGTSPVHLGPEN